MYYLMPSSKRKTWSPYFIFKEIIDYFGRCCFHGLGEFHSLRKVLSEKQSPVGLAFTEILSFRQREGWSDRYSFALYHR